MRQQIVLAQSQVKPTLGTKCLAGDEIEAETTIGDNLPLHRLVLGRPHPAKDRLHPEHQLPGVERLGEIIVGTGLQAEDAIRFGTLRGEHDHRGLNPVPTQSPEHLQPAHTGKHEIQNDQVEALFPGQGGCTAHPATCIPAARR